MSSKEKFTDESLMPIGKHKGKKLGNVPVGWFEWFKHNNEGKTLYGDWKMLMDYINENWDVMEVELEREETNRIRRRQLGRRG